MCEKYKVNAVLEYNECGNDFAGRVTLEWDGEELSTHVEEWDYHEGVYAMDSDQWMTSELEWQMDNAKEEGLSAEDFVKQFPFLSEDDRQDIITTYNE
jgi:dTDP-D-glucose 4,6-dehydratase